MGAPHELERIRTAAARLCAEHGFDATTTDAVDAVDRFTADWHRRLISVLGDAIDRGELRQDTPARELGFNLLAARR